MIARAMLDIIIINFTVAPVTPRFHALKGEPSSQRRAVWVIPLTNGKVVSELWVSYSSSLVWTLLPR